MTAQLIGPGTIPESATSSIIDLGGLTRDTTQSTTAESGTGLKRTMNLRSVTLMGLAYMTPIIALGTFGVIA